MLRVWLHGVRCRCATLKCPIRVECEQPWRQKNIYLPNLLVRHSLVSEQSLRYSKSGSRSRSFPERLPSTQLQKLQTAREVSVQVALSKTQCHKGCLSGALDHSEMRHPSSAPSTSFCSQQLAVPQLTLPPTPPRPSDAQELIIPIRRRRNPIGTLARCGMLFR